MAQATVNVTNPDAFFYTDITPVSVGAGNRHVISVNTTSGGVARDYYYFHASSGTSGSLYPFSVGRVTVEAPFFKAGASPVFPDYNNESDFPFIRGVADFQFEYVERQ